MVVYERKKVGIAYSVNPDLFLLLKIGGELMRTVGVSYARVKQFSLGLIRPTRTWLSTEPNWWDFHCERPTTKR
jgi:hypothetical protein